MDENAEAYPLDQKFIEQGKKFQESANSYGAMVIELENQLDHARHMTKLYTDAAAAMYGLADSAQIHMREHDIYTKRDEPDVAGPIKYNR